MWFASRGEGIIYSEEKSDENSNNKTYKSPARILLNGLGADEQLAGSMRVLNSNMAGYARHRGVFKHRGWEGLQQELEKDFYRLWKRNLGNWYASQRLIEGRDDRIISDHSREVRFPFLDENFVTILNTIPLYEVCNLNQPPGVGDKMILRQVILPSLELTAGS